MQVKLKRKSFAQRFAAIVCFFWPVAIYAASGKPADDAAQSTAICPIVYPVDQSPSDRGYHYLFYGNGFFINDQGYLVTAAHVLSQLHGGQPYILLRQPSGIPQFVPATLVGMDRDHDVAVLRATPNPFEGKYKVGFLALSFKCLMRGHAVLAVSLHPTKPVDAYTADASVEERSSGEVFDFQFSQLEKGRGATKLLLFNHQVRRGQSGAPVISAESKAVVGFVEGQWLRSTFVPLAKAAEQEVSGVGAAVPIHYAIALLQEKDIPWHATPGAPEPFTNSAREANGFSPPTPLSLVSSAYPSQSLFGGEVLLDALIDSRGRLVDARVVRGPSVFLEDVLSTVRTWSFVPAHLDGTAVSARIGITFQFSRPHAPRRTTAVPDYDEPLPASADRGALPAVTVEPQYPATSVGEDSVILYGLVEPQGQLTSVQIVCDSESLSSAAVSAVGDWRFVPGRRAGRDTDAAAIVVFAFRDLRSAHLMPQTK
jgi:outer membrane biosynthesis protein TonB